MKFKKLLLILFILNWLVIWVNSALPAKASHTLSDWLVYGVETAFEPASSAAPASSVATSSEATSSVPQTETGISQKAKQTLDESAWTNPLRTVFRKTAHALEFLTFGFLAMLVLAGGDLRRWAMPTAVGLFVALTDETIQSFNTRTSAIADIWLDLAGYAVGLLLAAGIAALVRRRRARD